MITARVTGDQQLVKDLDRIRRGVRQLTRSSVNRGLTVIKAGVANEAPVGKTRRLKQATGKRLVKGNENREEINGKVGPDVGKRRLRKDGSRTGRAPHSHLVVLGTQDRFTRTGARRGRMRQNNYVDRGFAKSASRAASTVTDTFADKLQKASQ